MGTLLKDLYSPAFYERFLSIAPQALPLLEPAAFMREIFAPGWEEKTLKERMSHTATSLRRYLPEDFEQAALQLEELVTMLQEASFFGASLEFLFLPDYIEKYGLAHPEAALRAFEIITPFTSCEFAIRPFITAYPDMLYEKLRWWSTHPNHHVRRLSSEGCRPRLPWGMALGELKKDPSPILGVLENLKEDPSEYVRRSVANNLNDIAKDHPELVLSIAQKWKGISTATDAIVKHGSRTLLKKGHRGILAHYGLQSRALDVSKLTVSHKRIPMGGNLSFQCRVENRGKKALVIRLEYAVYFRRKNNTHYRKVFKISERSLAGGESLEVRKQHSFRPITTRVYYPGEHRLGILVNGSEKAVMPFRLLV